MTRRPTFSELKSVVMKLSTIYSGIDCPQPHTTNETHSKAIDELPCKNEKIVCNEEQLDSCVDKVSNWRLNSFTDSGEEKATDNGKSISTKKRKTKKKKPAVEKETDPVIKELHELISKGDISGVQGLLGNNAATVDPSDCTSLSSCIDINSLHDGNTALHVAAAGGQGELVILLMSKGADPTIRLEYFNYNNQNWLVIIILYLLLIH